MNCSVASAHPVRQPGPIILLKEPLLTELPNASEQNCQMHLSIVLLNLRQAACPRLQFFGDVLSLGRMIC